VINTELKLAALRRLNHLRLTKHHSAARPPRPCSSPLTHC
jgi:hypothetical protein